MKVVYEDNHIIIVDKTPGEIVQGDKTGDTPLSEMVKSYLKEKYNKPGNVFCGVVHRLDRPVAGLVIFAKTSKALTRLNEMHKTGGIKKTYWAIVKGCPEKKENTLENYIISRQENNKSYIVTKTTADAKLCKLKYKLIASGDNYSLLEIELITGRKHQIRAQLSNIGHPIMGDLKYGAKRSLQNGGIGLLAKHIEFEHPVSHTYIKADSTIPQEFKKFSDLISPQ